MKTSKRLEGIGEYYFSQKLREVDQLNREGKDIINLGIGSPDLPPHPSVIETLRTEALKGNVHGYQSYKGSPVLRNAMAAWYKTWYDVELDPNSEILPLIGSKEGIMHICMTYLDKGDKVLVPDPGYPTYEAAVRLAGGKTVPYELREKNNYEPDWDRLEKKSREGVKLMFVNYPQMPTGEPASVSLFEKLVAFAQANKILLVHDNPYSFILNDHPLSLLRIPGGRDCVIELNSLSKSHNMAGWRVGMLCGAAKRIEEVMRFKSNMDSGMFLPVQLAAATALSLEGDWYRKLNEVYRTRRDHVYKILDLLGCMYRKQQSGLFVWAQVPKGYKNGFELADDVLYKSNVFITPGGIFGNAGKKFIRLSLCAKVENLEEAFRRIDSLLINQDKNKLEVANQ